MRIRTVLGFAVLSIVSLACSGDGPTPPLPPPVTMCSYPVLGHLKSTDPGCVPPPPAPTISINPPSTSAMIGDSMTVRAVATNATSCTFGVTGGAERVATYGCDSVRVVFKSLGTTTITASATGPGGTINAEAKQVSVLPRPASSKDTLSVSLFSSEESDVPIAGMKMWAIWISGGVRDSIETSMSGSQASVEIPISLDSVLTRFEGDSRYHKSEMKFGRSAYFHKTVPIILARKQWTIPSHLFAGQTLPVSMVEARKRAGNTDPSSYIMLATLFGSSSLQNKAIIGWPENAFPIPVGIKWSASNSQTPAADSIHFWTKVIPVIHERFGPLFTPGRIVGNDVPRGMIAIVLGNSTGSNPNAEISVDETNGDIYNALITLPGRQYVEDYTIQTVVHEFGHALGVQHTCAWVTRMTSHVEFGDGGACSDKLSSTPTAMDVAMYQFAHSIRRAMKKRNAYFPLN